MSLGPTDWGLFADMLASLTALEVLAIHALDTLSERPRKIVLPRSLKIAAFINSDSDFDRAIGVGLQSSHPPSLRTFILGNSGHSELWNGLNIATQIILDRIIPDEQPLLGFRATKLIYSCNQSKELGLLLDFVVYSLPDPVREIVIDMNACGSDELFSLTK
ncbi:hypothetical protein GYMLUDRAFT_245257 [Collybiopsis luxurians FD-317 M1]|uniref:Uncharacterized protein n=1 Tax=Collybiopsis luxurians FD-317 M1 TaxID=944289 RepID=A0A0D0CLX3_9AGAR|nr:hypothetical protein GYMLUDRAFT_245257 [Collybiopsis luxurians FD-317 M1]